MTGTLEIRDLRCTCIIGALPHERTEPQEILIDIVARTDFSRASQSDSLSDAVDYTEMAKIACDACVTGKFQLLEAQAKAIASTLLDHFLPLQSVQVRIRKPAAISSASSAGVSLQLVRNP